MSSRIDETTLALLSTACPPPIGDGNGRQLAEDEWYFFQQEYKHDRTFTEHRQSAERARMLARAERFCSLADIRPSWPKDAVRRWFRIAVAADYFCALLVRGARIFVKRWPVAKNLEATFLSRRRYFSALTVANAIEVSLQSELVYGFSEGERAKWKAYFGYEERLPLQLLSDCHVPPAFKELLELDLVFGWRRSNTTPRRYERVPIVRVLEVDPPESRINAGARVLVARPIGDRGPYGERTREVKLYGFHKLERLERRLDRDVGIGLCLTKGKLGAGGIVCRRQLRTPEELFLGGITRS